MGLVHIYCGDGKGKTSAAVGLAVRAAGCGKRVVIARFLKTDNSGEVEILKKIPEVTLIPCRKTFGFVRSMDEETKRECAAYHRELFGEAVKLAEHADLVVFDEIMAAVNYGMVPERDVLEFLENRPGRDQTDGLEIVLTGRDPSEKRSRQRIMSRRSVRESIRLTAGSWRDGELSTDVTVHGHSMPAHCNRILPMLRIPNRQNLLSQTVLYGISVQKIPTVCSNVLIASF